MSDGGSPSPGLDMAAWATEIRAGNRGALARAITLVESDLSDDLLAADALLARVGEPDGPTYRVGVSGLPGAGKSTLIDRLGERLIGQGHRVAVLAVDPSSTVSGGSILGDKTRMSRLSRHDEAFIRPSPTRGHLGGVGARTQATVRLCEAAGYDIVLVETVGVGQSEVTVREMVDVFAVLLIAGAGDSLQGIKRGVLEVVDMVLINKADGDGVGPAELAAKEYAMALRIMRGQGGAPKVIPCSAIDGVGVRDAWEWLSGRIDTLRSSGELDTRRANQRIAWMWRELEAGFKTVLRATPGLREEAARIEEQVSAGTVSPSSAAAQILARMCPSAP